MENLELVRTFKTKVSFTPIQWGLHNESNAAVYATKALNNALQLSINCHSERSEVEREMAGVMSMFPHVGATDEMAVAFLHLVLDYTYGTLRP